MVIEELWAIKWEYLRALLDGLPYFVILVLVTVARVHEPETIRHWWNRKIVMVGGMVISLGAFLFSSTENAIGIAAFVCTFPLVSLQALFDSRKKPKAG